MRSRSTLALLLSLLTLTAACSSEHSTTDSDNLTAAPTAGIAPTDEHTPDVLAEMIAQQMLDKNFAATSPDGKAALEALVARDSGSDRIVSVSKVTCTREPGAHGGMTQDGFCSFRLGERIGNDSETEAGYRIEATVSHGTVTYAKIALVAG